jgi:phage terminase large subunit-like protein
MFGRRRLHAVNADTRQRLDALVWALTELMLKSHLLDDRREETGPRVIPLYAR